MKKSFLIIFGLVTLGFGLINILWYAPHSLTLVFYNQPFPFPHLEAVEIHESGKGTSISYDSIGSAIRHPYWLAWSLSLYAGIIMLGVFAFKKIVDIKFE